ncbi:DUF4760 domain-containing protein [Bradyrhizobium genosp. P]|uniref:DUF4760 domain-containing protein n=1 Tax=Bradyrhizobium genosp. P TaxID=83641 RepID=UPI003CE6E746
MFEWGTAPQWLTALIAGGALIAAVTSISSQREIARKRAAMDFFSKTEMDRDTLASHKKFTDAVAMLETHLKAGNSCAGFVSTPEYWHIRDYLNDTTWPSKPTGASVLMPKRWRAPTSCQRLRELREWPKRTRGSRLG